MTAGITGHQNLGSKEIYNWSEREIIRELKKIDPLKGYTSLAIGADQLFAEILYEMNIPYEAVIPSKNYEETFDAAGRKSYFDLLQKANNMIRLSFSSPSEAAFLAAGKKISDLSDVLFAIWNNKPAKGLGGTADIVKYAKTKKRKIIHFNPLTQTIDYINLDEPDFTMG